MNADPEVREHLGDPLTREQSDASVTRFRAEFDQRGYGWWAVEVTTGPSPSSVKDAHGRTARIHRSTSATGTPLSTSASRKGFLLSKISEAMREL